jgi:hypothetical protein
MKEMVVPAPRLAEFLRGYRAQYKADVSHEKRHIYWSPSHRVWIKARRSGGNIRLTFHQDCPCSDPD